VLVVQRAIEVGDGQRQVGEQTLHEGLGRRIHCSQNDNPKDAREWQQAAPEQDFKQFVEEEKEAKSILFFH